MTGSLGLKLTESTKKQYTESGSLKEKTQTEGFLTETEFNYTGESLAVSMNLNRSLEPSGAGELNEQTRLI